MPVQRSHQWIDARSLALAKAVAAKLEVHPELFEIVRENLSRWKKNHDPWPQALREWELIVDQGMEYAVAALVEETDQGRRRRQSNPFPGILTQAERNAIFREYETISV